MTKMLKKIWRFLRDYKQLSFVLIALIVGAALDLVGLDTYAHWFLGTVALMNVIPIILGMVESVKQGSYGLDILALTAIVASVLLHEYWAAIVVVLMLTGGEAIEDYAESRAKNELTST